MSDTIKRVWTAKELQYFWGEMTYEQETALAQFLAECTRLRAVVERELPICERQALVGVQAAKASAKMLQFVLRAAMEVDNEDKR